MLLAARTTGEEKGAIARSAARFFTLEYGVQNDMQTPRTVLCEWNFQGIHLNYGDGPPAEFSDFAAAIRKLVGYSRSVH